MKHFLNMNSSDLMKPTDYQPVISPVWQWSQYSVGGFLHGGAISRFVELSWGW